MSAHSYTEESLNRLFIDLEDGTIPVEDHGVLMDLLATHPEVRKAYRAHMQFVALIQSKAETMAELEGIAPISAKRNLFQLPRFAKVGLAAAAMIAIGVSIYWIVATPEPVSGRIVAESGSSWEFKAGGINEAGGFLPGTIVEVEMGRVEIPFPDDSRVEVAGGTTLQIDGPAAVRLPLGRIWIKTGGERFLVKTPELQLLDLGTEFGVSVSPNQLTDVHVAVGRVRATRPGNEEQHIDLVSGEAASISPGKEISRIPYDRSPFQKPTASPHSGAPHQATTVIRLIDFDSSSGDGFSYSMPYGDQDKSFFSVIRNRRLARSGESVYAVGLGDLGDLGQATPHGSGGNMAGADHEIEAGSLPMDRIYRVSAWFRNDPGDPITGGANAALLFKIRAGEETIFQSALLPSVKVDSSLSSSEWTQRTVTLRIGDLAGEWSADLKRNLTTEDLAAVTKISALFLATNNQNEGGGTLLVDDFKFVILEE